MRAVGLAFLFLGVLAFLFPTYGQYVRFIHLTGDESRLLGGLMVAVGALTLAIYGRRT